MGEINRNDPEYPLVVEIGPDFPVYRMFDNETMQRIRDGGRYVGITSDEEVLLKREKMTNAGVTAKVDKMIEGDLRNLPLRDGVASQIWLMNVFGDFQNRSKRNPDGSETWELGLGGVFEELARVLKSGGKIYIGEVYNPIRKIDWMPNADYSELGLTKKVYRGKEEVKEFVKEMGGIEALLLIIKNAGKYEPFFMVLEKI